MTKQPVSSALGTAIITTVFARPKATSAFIEVWNIAGPWKFEPGNKEIFDV
jgi:hypothetical protein